MSDGDTRSRHRLIALDRGIYTVPETCRILGRGMTARKVHYWLNTDLLGDPVRRGQRGTPVLLSFEQVLRVKALQRIRDTLRFSLPSARRALAWIVSNLVADADEWQELHFFRSGGRLGVGLRDGSGFLEIGTAQGVLPVSEDLADFLTDHLQEMRREWETKTLPVEGFSRLQSSALVHAGSPVIADTRIETSFVANLAQEMSLGDVHSEIFPDVDPEAIREAAEFERVA